MQVSDAVRKSNNDVGGRVLEISGTEHFVRGRGYLKNPKDLEQVVLGSFNGTPVTVRDVAHVQLGPAQRRGLADLDGEGEVVGAVVIMRQGDNALQVIDAVKARLAELKPTLPEGVEVVPTYDRSELIRASIGTLRRTLFEEILVVSLVILAFLLHVRSHAGAGADAADRRAARLHSDGADGAHRQHHVAWAASRSPSARWSTPPSSWSRTCTGASSAGSARARPSRAARW